MQADSKQLYDSKVLIYKIISLLVNIKLLTIISGPWFVELPELFIIQTCLRNIRLNGLSKQLNCQGELTFLY